MAAGLAQAWHSTQQLLSASSDRAAAAWLTVQHKGHDLAQHVKLPSLQPAVALPLIMASGVAYALASLKS